MSKRQPADWGLVAVLFGGTSSERPISLKSGQAVADALERCGLAIERVDVGRDFFHVLAEQERGARAKWDRAFIVLHGAGGEDGMMQAALEMAGIPYTGSGVLASALGMDKWRTKQIWQAQQLPTPPSFLLHADTDWQQAIAALNHNAIVKPACEGSSIGMRRVHSAIELQQAYDYATGFAGQVLAERWVQGREYTVAVLNDRALPPIQLITNRDFYDYEAKYLSDNTQYLCPCGLADADEKRLKALAETAVAALGCSGWARIDVMQDEVTGEFLLLEVNTVPGMTDHSLVPMAAQASGMNFDQLVLAILASSDAEA